MGRTLLSWSGGKDSAVTLEIMRESGTPPDGLVTTFVRDRDEVSHHGVSRSLLERQAAAIGLPLLPVELPDPCPNGAYSAALAEAFATIGDLEAVAYGDLFLEDHRVWRTEQLAEMGLEARFPLWGYDTADLARRLVEGSWQATVCTVDTDRLDASFCGRAYDATFLADLPDGIDPAGEPGEFHTFVTAGPVLRHRVAVAVTGTRTAPDGRFVRAELIAA